MILLTHIIIASLSVLYTAYIFFRPTQKKLNVSYVLTALTIISGSYLVFTKPAHMAQTCVTGLVYLSIMLVGIFAIKHKLATQKI